MSKSAERIRGLEYEKSHDRMYIYLHGENADEVCEILKSIWDLFFFLGDQNETGYGCDHSSL